jgi:hypothetical protein
MKILVCISHVPDTTSKINFVNGDSEFDTNEIFNYTDSIKYDTSKIGLQQNGDFVALTEKVKPNFQTKHIIRRTFLSDNGTGYIDTTSKFFYNINKDNFELKSGIENEFYKLLNLTKKARR